MGNVMILFYITSDSKLLDANHLEDNREVRSAHPKDTHNTNRCSIFINRLTDVLTITLVQMTIDMAKSGVCFPVKSVQKPELQQLRELNFILRKSPSSKLYSPEALQTI
jgi:hypothetical protein